MYCPVSRTHDPLGELVQRLQPINTQDAQERAGAWNEWLSAGGAEPVRKFIRWSNGTAVEDDEILQETLIVAYLKVERGQYQDRNLPFTAFLKKIAHYKIMEASRLGQRQIALEDVGERIDTVEVDASNLDAIDHWVEHQNLRWALEQLSPRRRRIMLMYESGYSTAEIAACYGIREELVRKEKSLAMRQLRDLLTPRLELKPAC